MPFSERGQMKREMEQAIQHQEKCAEYLLRLRAKYDPDYPQYIEAIDGLLTVISALVEALNQFAAEV